MSELRKLKTWREVHDALNAYNGPDIIQTLLLALNLGNKVQIFQEKKRWIGLFKFLGIADTDIIMDVGNSLVAFWNTYVKPYNRLMGDTIINN